MVGTFAEDLDAVLERVDATGFVEFFCGDGSGRVEEATIDPVLDFVQVDWDKCLAVTACREQKREEGVSM